MPEGSIEHSQRASNASLAVGLSHGPSKRSSYGNFIPHGLVLLAALNKELYHQKISSAVPRFGTVDSKLRFDIKQPSDPTSTVLV